MGVQGTRIAQEGSGDGWVRPPANGGRVIALLNRGPNPEPISPTAAATELPNAGAYIEHDLSSGRIAETASRIEATVPPNSVVLSQGLAGRAGAHPTRHGSHRAEVSATQD